MDGGRQNFGGEVPCRTHSEHRRGTLEQGSKGPNAHIGPCYELETARMGWDRLQRPPRDLGRDEEVRNVAKLLVLAGPNKYWKKKKKQTIISSHS